MMPAEMSLFADHFMEMKTATSFRLRTTSLLNGIQSSPERPADSRALLPVIGEVEGNKAMYAVISHSPAYTAQGLAASAHIPGRDMSKVVVVNLDGKLARAILAANREVGKADS